MPALLTEHQPRVSMSCALTKHRNYNINQTGDGRN